MFITVQLASQIQEKTTQKKNKTRTKTFTLALKQDVKHPVKYERCANVSKFSVHVNCGCGSLFVRR